MECVVENRDLKYEQESLATTLERLGGRALKDPEFDWLLGIVLRVCDAAAVAHDRGSVHRGLEPRHVMVGRRGEVDLIALDAAPGAPGYMAPEQAWGRYRDVDARTDVYGIGGILYAMLTLTAPHHGDDVGGDLALARTDSVCGPQQACPGRVLPAALCKIAARALSRSPADRHPTIEILKQDIERFMRGRSWAGTKAAHAWMATTKTKTSDGKDKQV